MHPAGAVSLPRCANEALPKVTTAIGMHSAQTIGQRNPPGYPPYPNVHCHKCKGTVDKFKCYATHLFENTPSECMLVFELANDHWKDDIFGESTKQGMPLIQLIVPIVEKVSLS